MSGNIFKFLLCKYFVLSYILIYGIWNKRGGFKYEFNGGFLLKCVLIEN